MGRIWVRGPGKLRIGNRVRLDASSAPIELNIGPGAEIVLGDDVEIQGGTSIEALQSVHIGDGSKICARCKLIDNDFHSLSGNRHQKPPSAPITLEAGVTLGSGAIVLRGARVPRDSVIAPGAVVRGRLVAGETAAKLRGDAGALAANPHQPRRFLARLGANPLDVLSFARSWIRGAMVFRHCERGARVYVHGPVRVRNQGAIRLGNRVVFFEGMIPSELVCHRGARIRVGDSTLFNYAAFIEARESVTIGERCMIASSVRISDTAEGASGPIAIGDDVWIAHGAVIAPGISVGAGSVISAGSVVTKDVPPLSLAIGNPARCIGLSLMGASE